MRDLFRNQLVDMTDPSCEFIMEFNKEIKKYGAIVYNFDTNSYQFIRKFSHIDYKKELLPDFIKVQDTDSVLKAMQITIHYEFDPETETNQDNLDIWNEELSKIELPVFGYEEDGEFIVEKYVPINTKESKHAIWFLSKDSYNYILDCDLLMLTPIIKNVQIAKDLITNYGIHPFEFQYDSKDMDDYEIPALYGVYQQLEDAMEEEDYQEYDEDCHDDGCHCGHGCSCDDDEDCHCEHDCDCDDEHECHCGHDCDCDDEHECHFGHDCDCDNHDEECHCKHH